MNRFLQISASLFATAALSGCASIFGHGFADRSSPQATPAQPADGNAELAAARQLMDEGLTAQAIDHFRAAQMDPGALPAASNGLGVAYARLGRLDLADRYFRMAVSLDPSNQRYAANMVRLQNDYALAQASTTVAPAPALAQAQAQPRAETAEVAATDPPGSIERISRGEVHIRTVDVAAAPPRVVVASRDQVPASAAEKLAAADQPVTISTGYPVRIDLAKRGRTRAGKPAATDYPQRIDLAKVVVAD